VSEAEVGGSATETSVGAAGDVPVGGPDARAGGAVAAGEAAAAGAGAADDDGERSGRDMVVAGSCSMCVMAPRGSGLRHDALSNSSLVVWTYITNWTDWQRSEMSQWMPP